MKCEIFDKLYLNLEHELFRKNPTTSREWRAATGLTAERFAQLLAHFKQAYFRLNGTDMIERGAFTPYEVALKTEEELLLFTLFSFKANLTYDLLGLVSGMDGSNAKRNQELGIMVFQRGAGANRACAKAGICDNGRI